MASLAEDDVSVRSLDVLANSLINFFLADRLYLFFSASAATEAFDYFKGYFNCSV